MAGFLYFIEGVTDTPNGLILRNAGLDNVLHEGGLAFTVTDVGPCNSRKGIILTADSPQSPHCGYFPEKQTWKKWDKYCVGFETANPPKAVDLVRPEIIRRHKVKMVNDDVYDVPCFQFLPDKLKLNLNGEVEREPLPRFAHVVELANRCWFDMCIDSKLLKDNEIPKEHKRLTESEQLKLCIEMLAINYRIGICEVYMIELFDDRSKRKTLEAILDIPSLEAISKVLESEKADKKKVEAATGG